MTADVVIDIAREVVWVIVKTSAPLLIVCYQYFSDDHIYSGTDADICTKVYCGDGGFGTGRRMDFK